MANWNKPGYWRWWWNYRAGPEAKLFTVLTPVLLLAGLGFALAGRLPSESRPPRGWRRSRWSAW
jgi:hypothetical protein